MSSKDSITQSFADVPAMLSVAQVAEITGASGGAILKAIRAGKLRSFALFPGHRAKHRILKGDLIEWVTAVQVPAIRGAEDL